MPQLTLQYLPMHGRAEAIRMFLHYCGLDFKDDVLEYDVFARKKDAKMLPFDQACCLSLRRRGLSYAHVKKQAVNASHPTTPSSCVSVLRGPSEDQFRSVQVPVLYVDGLPIAQTGSILRYLSRISSNDIEDPVRAALADSAFEAAQEMPMAQVYVAVNLMEETEVRESAKAFLECLPEYLVNWSKILGDQKYFHGDAPGYADFFIWSLLDIGRQLVPLTELMKGHAALRAWSAAVKKLPAVATVLSNRPKIRDLSKFKL